MKKESFTRYPRWFRVLAPELGLAELRVLITVVEGTRGWNKEWVDLSQRDLARRSGLDKTNAIKAVRILKELEVVAQRTQDGKTSYGLKELGNKDDWVRIASGTSPVVSARLARWDTTQLPPCSYSLRLRVWDRTLPNCDDDLRRPGEYVMALNIGDRCDINGDGQVDAFDIEPFLMCLFP